ncbi:unnamed protein product [Lupinus luteus]|uniref:Uncharacterized protein n=1 Tax=Lupinus luteus TaxID=3873 RepID=A0AAV1WM81_LUPLU
MEEEPNYHVIDTERLAASMYDKINNGPIILSKGACRFSYSIFMVPQVLKDANPEAYQPEVVSIGPYHHGHNRLKMIEEVKWHYLRSLLSRTKTSLEYLLKAMVSLESKARECYSKTITLSTRDFIEMMVLDGCFLIELFRKVAGLVSFEEDDPLVTMAGILPFLCSDFLLLENQIPFFILERLFELPEVLGEDLTLSSIAIKFFNNSMCMPKDILDQKSSWVGNHLLDLVRTCFIPSDLNNEAMGTPRHVIKDDRVKSRCPWNHINYLKVCIAPFTSCCLLVRKVRTRFIPSHKKEEAMDKSTTPMIHCVSKLQRAGIIVTPGNNNDSILQVKFKHGIIQMPTITMDVSMCSFLLNCVAFEECYCYYKHFTTYLTLLDYLIKTPKDVEYLCDRNVIVNNLGTEEQVASFINNTGREFVTHLDCGYLYDLFKEVHTYYGKRRHVHWASFKSTYFDTPWSFISVLAAFVLLVLTAMQTFFAAYQSF